jgi:hypothetical protein
MVLAKKKGRTVRLTPDVDTRLIALCAHLGINPNAYMTAEIGKSVARDEVSYASKMRMNSLMDGLEEMVRESAQSD